jgi:NAD(P)-dependent dehydrogenase (short-subunit alcohol dehydrogenase family)
MLDYDGRVIIVTGAGRGMGIAHARALAARGANIVVNDLGGELDGSGSDAELARSAADEINTMGRGRAIASAQTVATSAGANSIIAQAIDQFGRLDGILHNAGISTLVPLAHLTDEQWEQMLRVHLFGAFYLTRAAWPHLTLRGGRILYISSAVGLYGVPEMAHYGAAKTGLIGLARVAATEGRSVGISVNVLGVAASTRMMDLAMLDSPKMTEWFARHMKPELPSAAAVWLLHPDCHVSGRIYEAFGPRMAEVLIAETAGYTRFGITPEEFRDHFSEITARDDLMVPGGPDEFHARMFDIIVKAGAQPLSDDAATSKMAVPSSNLNQHED